MHGGGDAQKTAFLLSKISVGGNPIASRFDSERRKPSILNKVAGCFELAAKGLEDRPVVLAGHDHGGVLLLKERAAECECLALRAWFGENPWKGTHPHDRSQHLRRYSVGRRAIDDRLEPGLVL
jgi:hypothetical protein